MSDASKSLPFALLTPISSQKPVVDPADIFSSPDAFDVGDLGRPSEWHVAAIDIETRGTSVADPDTQIVGVGVAWRTSGEVYARYFNYASMDDVDRGQLLTALSEAPACIAHNLLFDGAHIWREATRLGVPEPQWKYCTFGLYKQLASESFPGQSWGLKSAMTDLLGWTDTNEVRLDEWLVSHGWVTDGPTRKPEEKQEEYAARVAAGVAEGKEYRPAKGEMWRVPPEILGEYCILDCLATLQLFDAILWPVLEQFPELDEYHTGVFVPMDRLLWTQQFAGIRVDIEKLRAHGDYLRRKLVEAEERMRASPLSAGIQQIEVELFQEHMEKEPPKYKKQKSRTEPAHYKKNGEVSKNWLRWAELSEAPPEVRLDWLAWDEKRRSIGAGEVPTYKFNPGSVDQLRRLLYGKQEIGIPCRESPLIEWEATTRTAFKKGKQIPIFSISGVHGWVDIPGTDAGQLPVNSDLFTQLPPDLGEPLQLYAAAEQELGYVDAYLAAAREHAPGEYRVHPGWVNPGTKTGRLAGRDPNLQQICKTVEFMSCLVADPGHVWLEMDWSALEPHVLAELSRDPALLKLYGPGAPKHDVYLYSGAHYAVLGDSIRRHYDVDAPDVAAAKKECKREREACKVVVLAKSYGAGAKKIHMGFRLAGFDMTPEEAEQISDSHDEMYAASGKRFHEQLSDEWRERGGWLLSGLGHPISVWEGAKKDLINRVVQKTGHDIHMQFAVDLVRRIQTAGIPSTGVVRDFHDQLIEQIPMSSGEECLELVRQAVDHLNQELGGIVRLKGEPKLCTDMAQAKEAEFSWLEKYGS